VAVYTIRNPKYIGLNHRTSRFAYDGQKKEWQPVTLGQDDVPTTAREVQDLIAFVHAGYNVDSILNDISKVKT
jgi:hypothetical protein